MDALPKHIPTPFQKQVWEKSRVIVVFGPVGEAKWFPACAELDIPSVLMVKDETQAATHLKNISQNLI